MSLFTRKKETGVRSFILGLVNNNCPELRALDVGPRIESRVNLTVVVLVTPLAAGKPALERTFAAVTKEFSNTGVSLALPEPRPVDEVILGFRWESDMQFVRAKAVHLDPMGAGFYQLGLKMTEVVHVSDYPALRELRF